jgi:hypothetical protein
MDRMTNAVKIFLFPDQNLSFVLIYLSGRRILNMISMMATGSCHREGRKRIGFKAKSLEYSIVIQYRE